MGWSIGYDDIWNRDIGYGVPAVCDYPGCDAKIDRGLSYVCGGEPYGGDDGCGLFFCGEHLWFGETGPLCERCMRGVESGEDIKPFDPKPDVAEWVRHKLTHASWARWRSENPDEINAPVV